MPFYTQKSMLNLKEAEKEVTRLLAMVDDKKLSQEDHACAVNDFNYYKGYVHALHHVKIAIDGGF